MDPSIVTPAADPAAAPAPQVDPAAAAPVAPAPTAPPPTPAKLPDDLLKIPAFQGLLVGKPGAVSVSAKGASDRAETKLFAKNRDALMKAGMGTYLSLDGQTGVLFNQAYVHPDELKQADAQGTLLQVAPDLDSINHGLSKAGANHPALNPNHVPATGFKSAPPVPVPQAQQAPMPGPPASAQRALMASRVMNMNQGSPTSGPVPGAGRLLNSVLKPVL